MKRPDTAESLNSSMSNGTNDTGKSLQTEHSQKLHLCNICLVEIKGMERHRKEDVLSLYKKYHLQ